MKLKLNISKLLDVLTDWKCYKGIEDLPISIWFKINETNNYNLLIKNRLIPFSNCEKQWIKIYDEFIARIGLNDDYKEYLETTKRIAIMQCNYILSPSPADKVSINRELRELEERTKGKTIKYNEIIAHVSKMQGYRIESNKVSVWEFYGYLKLENNGR